MAMRLFSHAALWLLCWPASSACLSSKEDWGAGFDTWFTSYAISLWSTLFLKQKALIHQFIESGIAFAHVGKQPPSWSVLLLKLASGGKLSKWDAAMASPGVEDVKGASSSSFDFYTSYLACILNVFCVFLSPHPCIFNVFCVFLSPHPRLCPGAIKLSLSGTTFLNCAQTAPPGNTLFPDVSPVRINMVILELYLPLVLRLFSLSPEGILSCT